MELSNHSPLEIAEARCDDLQTLYDRSTYKILRLSDDVIRKMLQGGEDIRSSAALAVTCKKRAISSGATIDEAEIQEIRAYVHLANTVVSCVHALLLLPALSTTGTASSDMVYRQIELVAARIAARIAASEEAAKVAPRTLQTDLSEDR